MQLRTVMAIVLFSITAQAPAQLSSIEIVGPKGELIAQDKTRLSQAGQKIADGCKDKDYWFKRMYGKKISGSLTVKLRVNQSGEVREVTRVSSTISDTSTERSMLFSLRQWTIDDVEFLGPGALVTCTFAFDSAVLDVPPWRYHGEFKCDSSVEKSPPRPSGIWNTREKTCLYLEVPYQPSATKRYSTFGNTEWKLYDDYISQYQCSNLAQWQVPDSQCYMALDTVLSTSTDSVPAPLQDLPSAVGEKLSAAGFSRLVAFYRQRGEYNYHSGTSIRTGGGSYYNAHTGSQSSGGPSVSMTFPSKNSDQSIIVSVYDLKTGKGLFHKTRKENDYSLELAIRSVVHDLFSQLRRANSVQ
jgi:hypothetical protein